ncbi:THO complex subunit 1 [Eurytemora carolleeae]|uniref:THO complex subunit 1 n=1 Tax=Eurytemora carolleeae TaxID=1294199 RepID=UPI000C7682CA|nr:THO complex subunit 1 [Eurytemora carolleeae]|eukprot:XP_023347729.1 THO complex subunit 1-like [Eurytemora affinis]
MADDETPAVEEDIPILGYMKARTQFSKALNTCFKENSLNELEKTWNSLATSDTDHKKHILDQCFREFLTDQLFPDGKPNKEFKPELVDKFVDFSIQASEKELCNPLVPIQGLADILDLLPLSSCEILFKAVEREVATWRSPGFYMFIRNNLLRICNDLLRRLSRTQNTVFCGRILLFLSKFFPFSERSALNVISEFNLENVTTFVKEEVIDKPEPIQEEKGVEVKVEAEKEKTANGDVKTNEEKEAKAGEVKEEEMEVTEEKNKEGNKSENECMEIELIVEEKVVLEDKTEPAQETKEEKKSREFKLYFKFWQLQDYFRNPTQCYQDEQWKQFCEYTQDILHIFQKRKLDTRASKKEEIIPGRELAATFLDQYFAKYLTNQNLLSLQLNDSNFRYQVLSGDQTKWIDDHRKKIFKLIEETPPNGKAFASSAKSILKRELIWSRWKNEGCPSFVIKSTVKEDDEKKTADEKPKLISNPRKRKAGLGELIREETKRGEVNLGNKGLTKLWNLNPDNLEACKDIERNFLPSLEEFFSEAIQEINPKNQVEEAYMKVNKGEWGWRALRLMSRRSQHFFLVGNKQISKLPEYLKEMIGKIAVDIGVDEDMDDVGMDEDVSETHTNGENGNGDSGAALKLTDDQIASLAVKLAPHYSTLIPKLGLSNEKVEECKQGDDLLDTEICLKLLMAWVELEGDGASPDEIRYMLESVKLSHIVEGII